MATVTARFRYLARLTPRMVSGRILQEARKRWLLGRVWDRSGDVSSIVLQFDNPALVQFASVYALQGDRFDETCDAVSAGTFISNGQSYDFGAPNLARWGAILAEDPTQVRLEHDFAFFAFCIPLVRHDTESGLRTTSELVNTLDAGVTGPDSLRRFEWSPIALALRTMALATAISLVDERSRQRMAPEIRTISGHLIRCGNLLRPQVERYLGYNHAAFTEAGHLVDCLLRGLAKDAERAAKRLARVIWRSVLPDGTWAERSPTYHVHMLLLTQALISSQLLPSSEMDRTRRVERLMRDALRVLVHPDGEVAILNDAGIGDAVSPRLVGWSHDMLAAPVLATAGYARVEAGSLSAIFDAGPMGPRSVIGHGHADFLSTEVCVGSTRLIVDPGVLSISRGPLREQTRSAASHNGPYVDGEEPAEFFGAWRVGWSAAAEFEDVLSDSKGEVQAITGHRSGRTRPWVASARRTIRREDQGVLRITDEWSVSRAATSRFLIPIEWKLTSQQGHELVFVHRNGSTAIITVTRGQISVIERARFTRGGPAAVEDAHLVAFAPTDSVLDFQISASPKTGRGSQNNAITR